MKVVTLETSLFKAICHKLAMTVKEQYRPDVVIAILSGGGYVAREMLHTLNSGKSIAYGEVSACRPGNDLKQKPSTNAILTSMPRVLLDWARMVESVVLRLFPRAKHRNISFDNLDNDTKLMLGRGNRRVLIVDDAIDSGATMSGVIKALNEQFPGNTIKTAAITVTTPQPSHKVDFKIFKNLELVRFPWSKDMKK